jgi:hypothetical protein
MSSGALDARAEPLFAVLRGSGLTLTVSEPAVDCSLRDDGEEPRLLSYIKAARLLHLLTGKAADVSSIHSPSLNGPSDKDAARVRGAQQQPASSQSQPQTQTAERAGVPAHTQQAGVGALAALRSRLAVADDVASVSAELRLPRLAIYVADGQLLLPAEVKCVHSPWWCAVAVDVQYSVLLLLLDPYAGIFRLPVHTHTCICRNTLLLIGLLFIIMYFLFLLSYTAHPKRHYTPTCTMQCRRSGTLLDLQGGCRIKYTCYACRWAQ